MGLSDRDWRRAAPGRWGATVDLDRSTVRIIEGTASRIEYSNLPREGRRRRRSSVRAIILGLIAIISFTAGWAIACGLIGAQWQGRGGVFEPPADQEAVGPKRLSSVEARDGVG